MNIEATIRKFIVDELLLGNDKGGLDNDTQLISHGIVDSLGLIRLIKFIEDYFNVIIEDDEVIVENFETINSLTMLLSQKTGASV